LQEESLYKLQGENKSRIDVDKEQDRRQEQDQKYQHQAISQLQQVKELFRLLELQEPEPMQLSKVTD